MFNPRTENAYLWDDRNWKTAFIGKDYQWLIEEGNGGRNLDARTYFFYMATVNTPAMALKMVGKGSKYAIVDKTEKGQFFDGGKNYKLTIPAKRTSQKFLVSGRLRYANTFGASDQPAVPK